MEAYDTILMDDFKELQSKISEDLYERVCEHVSQIDECKESIDEELSALSISFNIETKKLPPSNMDSVDPEFD